LPFFAFHYFIFAISFDVFSLFDAAVDYYYFDSLPASFRYAIFITLFSFATITYFSIADAFSPCHAFAAFRYAAAAYCRRCFHCHYAIAAITLMPPLFSPAFHIRHDYLADIFAAFFHYCHYFR